MSSGLECSFFEPEAGRWFYALQDWSCPAGAWDWREHATCFGPFSGYEEACEHLRNNHANPGGHDVVEFADYEADKVYGDLVTAAVSPDRPRFF